MIFGPLRLDIQPLHSPRHSARNSNKFVPIKMKRSQEVIEHEIVSSDEEINRATMQTPII